MKIQISIMCLWFLVCLPAFALENTDTVLLTNIGIWDGSSGEVRKDQHILIVAGEIADVGSERPATPPGTQLIDGNGHVAVGTITPGQMANFVVFDADPQKDISILARANLHTQLLVKDGLILENYYEDLKLSGPESDDPEHMPTHAIEKDFGWASIGFGGIIGIDGLDFAQDDESIQQVGDLQEYAGAGIGAARFVLYGFLGREQRYNYYMDWGYNGFDEGFDTNRNDEYTLYNLELLFPETKLGKLAVGRMKAPTTLSRNWGGAYMPLSARQSPLNALTRSRDNGVRLTNTAVDKRMTWGVGIFNDWLSTGNNIDDNNTYVTGRVTGLLLDDQPNEHLLQIGLGFRWTNFVEDSLRFHAAPGIPFVPNYLDTGDMPGNEARWLTGEFAWRKQNILISGEHVRTDLDSPTIGNPTFKGSYVWLEWTLTGESRAFNYETALFGRPIPSRDFTRGGKGLWSLGLAFSDTDLNEGPIDGGDMQQFTIGLNWYPQKSYRWSLEYGRIALDRQGLDSISEFLHVVFHVSNL